MYSVNLMCRTCGRNHELCQRERERERERERDIYPCPILQPIVSIYFCQTFLQFFIQFPTVRKYTSLQNGFTCEKKNNVADPDDLHFLYKSTCLYNLATQKISSARISRTWETVFTWYVYNPCKKGVSRLFSRYIHNNLSSRVSVFLHILKYL